MWYCWRVWYHVPYLEVWGHAPQKFFNNCMFCSRASFPEKDFVRFRVYFAGILVKKTTSTT